MLLEKFLPRRLLVRFVLIICVPIILIEILTVYLFYDRHWYNVTYYNSQLLSRDIKVFTNAVLDSNKNPQDVIVLADTFGFSFRLENNETTISQPYIPLLHNLTDLTDVGVEWLSYMRAASLQDDLREEMLIFSNVLGRQLSFPVKVYPLRDVGKIAVIVMLHNKSLHIIMQAKPLLNPTTKIFVFWIFFITFVFMSIALIFARNQIRSIIELSEVADKLGDISLDGKNVLNPYQYYKPSGPIEIKQAGYALARMYQRIVSNAANRTKMLAMISHDLRTPLTRILLQLEILPESSENEKLKEDAMSMKYMLDSYMDFARGENSEIIENINIHTWICELLNKNSEYCNINYTNANQDVIIGVKPLAFRRAITNIIENARKYADIIEISTHVYADKLSIIIQDNGCGIKKSERELVMQPFYRSSSARTIDSHGSVGLGLSIAKEIIQNHSGQIVLDDSSLKNLSSSNCGLKVIILLPIVGVQPIDQ